MKYYYKPIKEEIEKTYVEKGGKFPFAEQNYEIFATLIIEAENEDMSEDIRKTMTYIPHWKLIKTEE
jgi:hypothetical protein